MRLAKKSAMKQKTILALTAVAALGISAAFADDDIDLKLNGDFKGSAEGAAAAPGWTVDNAMVKKGGTARIVKGKEPRDFGMELTASQAGAMSVWSDFHATAGNTLKIEAEVSGSGTGMIGIQAYNAEKQPMPDHAQLKVIQPEAVRTEKKLVFQFDNSKVKFIRIQLSANPGAKITFEDVDAEFKLPKKSGHYDD